MEQQNETPDGAGSGGISSRGAEITVALVILFIGCVVAFDSFRLGAGWSPDGPQAGYFPFYTGVLICISGLVTLGQTLFSKMPRDKIFVEWGALRQVLSVLLPAAVYVLGIQLVGIYVSSALYIAGFMRLARQLQLGQEYRAGSDSQRRLFHDVRGLVSGPALQGRI